MEESRKKLARNTNDDSAGVTGAPAAKARQSLKSTDEAAMKISELQTELKTLKQSHSDVVDELNVKVDALQAENESQLREIQGLNSALKWAYATEKTPRQHWLERGHIEEYADAMDNLLSDMKRIIENLRVGGEISSDRIDIYFYFCDEDGNLHYADNDEVLVPYWKEFAAALRHWSEYHANDKCLKVAIYDVEMPKAVLDILRPAFEQSRIMDVFFDKSRHARDMADFAKKVLQANHHTSDVNFFDFNFAQEDVKAICGAIKSRNAGGHYIKSLTLLGCFEDGIDTRMLKTILTSITTGGAREVALGLHHNKMSSREAGVIAEFLDSNPSLARLILNANQFNDADAAVLADALSSNTNLKEIHVTKNGIKENGRCALLRTIFDVTSLSSCAESNHTCRVYGLERDISFLNSKQSASVNKWSKIFAMFALSGEDSFINIALLHGVSAQLIPVILDKCNGGFTDNNQELTDLYLELTNTARCQKHDVWDNLGEIKSLNCMHNLMKSWVVPSIFV